MRLEKASVSDDWLVYDWQSEKGCTHRACFANLKAATAFAADYEYAIDKRKDHRCGPRAQCEGER